ncbi:hypothetical protein LCGC14_0415000 [marine sediment metagenome]|uniref:Peptidase C14 caspase domain-containing protein n=1 Tax=marine sediment metagenome TaxID=412755 RepID=A0A0F9W1S9_9ZZZZ|nr:hypothetical protein [archaeon]
MIIITEKPTKKVALCIGMNEINKDIYGHNGFLASCENDAEIIETIAKDNNFDVTLFLTKDAIVKNITLFIRKMQSELKEDDLLFIFFFWSRYESS